MINGVAALPQISEENGDNGQNFFNAQRCPNSEKSEY